MGKTWSRLGRPGGRGEKRPRVVFCLCSMESADCAAFPYREALYGREKLGLLASAARLARMGSGWQKKMGR